MNVDFGQKHLIDLAWLLPLIAIVLTVLLVIRKKGKFGESYGNGNPLAFLLTDSPVLYYVILSAASIGGMALVLTITIGIRALIKRVKAKRE